MRLRGILGSTRIAAALRRPRTDGTWKGWRRAYLVCISSALGCTLFGPSDYPLEVEILAQGAGVPTWPPPIVEVGPGLVTVEVEEGFGDPGYRIRATAISEETSSSVVPRGIRIEVETEKLNGDFIAINWLRRYRFTVSSVQSGTFALRLRWQNDFAQAAYQSRMLVDTTITVP